MGNVTEALLHSSFPSLEVTLVNDILNQCDSDAQKAAEHLRALFPAAYRVKPPGQAEHQESLQEPWTPPTQSPVASPGRLIRRGTNTPPRAAGALQPEFMQLMFSSKPARPKQAEPDGPRQPPKFLGNSTREPRSNVLHGRDAHKNEIEVSEQCMTSGEGKQEVPHPVHASMPFLQHLLPKEKPSAKAPRSCKSNSGDSTDLSPGTPSGLYDVQASSAEWDLIMNNLSPAPKPMRIVSTPSGRTNKKQGVEQAVKGGLGMHDTIAQLANKRTASATSSAPDNDDANLVAQAPEKPGNEEAQEQLGLLQEMFPTMDADLVRDVVDNVQGNSEKACRQLLLIQNVADCGSSVNPSSRSSEDGCASATMDGAGSRGDAGSANGGRAWDISGVPVDYTFKDLTAEQKVALIRKELPLCTAEEAHNALEACAMDVNSAIASLSQVYDKDGRHVPACSTATLPKEVAELQQIFPSANPEALINALSVSDNNVNVAKATLQASGMNPIAKPCRIEPQARSPPKKPASGLFSPPQPANVGQLPLGPQLPSSSSQPPNLGRVWRRNHADNQRLYDEHRSLAHAFRADMDRAYKERGRAMDRGDWDLAEKLKMEFEQAKLNHGVAQDEAAKAIWKTKNRDLNDVPMKLDLHGLHVHEAIAQLKKTIHEWQASPESMRMTIKRLDVITGKGLHSVDHVARILHAVIQFVEEQGMTYFQKPHRDGVMIHLADTGQPLGDGYG